MRLTHWHSQDVVSPGNDEVKDSKEIAVERRNFDLTELREQFIAAFPGSNGLAPLV